MCVHLLVYLLCTSTTYCTVTSHNIFHPIKLGCPVITAYPQFWKILEYSISQMTHQKTIPIPPKIAKMQMGHSSMKSRNTIIYDMGQYQIGWITCSQWVFQIVSCHFASLLTNQLCWMTDVTTGMVGGGIFLAITAMIQCHCGQLKDFIFSVIFVTQSTLPAIVLNIFLLTSP